jgi:hypothetical protein
MAPGGVMADGTEYAQRNASRESTLWRRTPSVRRTVPPQTNLRLSSIDAQ